MAKIKYTQVKSKIGSTQRQKKTLEALGLKRISNSVEAEATPQVLGMLHKVRHLLKIEEVK
jgi:large subunit ribosomal protein L30